MEKRKYGVKAVQTLASRCALHDLYKPMNVELEKLLREYMKQGKVQVVRARPDGVAGYRAEDGALWPRPGACKVERAPGSNYTAVRPGWAAKSGRHTLIRPIRGMAMCCLC